MDLPQELGGSAVVVVALYCLEAPPQGDTCHSKVGGNHPPRFSFGCSLRFLLLQLLLRVSAAPIIGGMGFLSLCNRQLQQAGVEAAFSFSGHSLCRWQLLTVCPNVAELLAVVALRKAVLTPVCLHPDFYVAEDCQAENLLGFCRSLQSNEE
jgi:hypothetical protein